MSVGTLLLYYYELSSGASVITAMTIAFTVFVMYQIFNVFNCKAKGMIPNKTLIIAVFSIVFASVMCYLLALFTRDFQNNRNFNN